MSTTKAMTDLDWVKLAASKDDARPVLTGILINPDGETVATDSHRMHIVEDMLGPAGLRSPKTGREIEGRYPNYQAIIPQDQPHLTVSDFGGMIAILEAAVAANRSVGARETPRYLVTLPAKNGASVGFNPAYLLDVLKGATVGRGGVYRKTQFALAEDYKPMRVSMAELGPDAARSAILMPVRRPSAAEGPDKRFDLTEFLELVEEPAEEVAA